MQDLAVHEPALQASSISDVGMPPAVPGTGGSYPFKPSHRHKHSGKIQVLCVDDDMINQMVAETVLRSQGWKVHKALDGLQVRRPSLCIAIGCSVVLLSACYGWLFCCSPRLRAAICWR